MILRSLIDVSNSEEFQSFIKKYNFELVVKDQKIIAFSPCIILEVYGLNTEEILYFDVFTRDLENYSTIDRLLEGKDKSLISSIYENEKLDRTRLITTDVTMNLQRALKAEQFFFTYVKLMDALLSDFFLCNQNRYMNSFTPTSMHSKERLKKIISLGI